MQRAVVFALLAYVVSATPFRPAPLNAEWEHDVLAQVAKIAPLHSRAQDAIEAQDNAQMAWEVSPPNSEEPRARPPKLEYSISNLRGVMDRLQMENINDAAVKDAMKASFGAKRAEIESRLAIPQQAITTRQEQRRLCDKEVRGLTELDDVVHHAMQRGAAIKKMREDQTTHYMESTEAIRKITMKNWQTLASINQLLAEEIASEQKRDTPESHYDSVALRQQAPDDMLRHATTLANNLGALMKEKLQHQEEGLKTISEAFACKQCEIDAAKLAAIDSTISKDLKAAKEKCTYMSESHRALDEADREKVLALKKELTDLEVAERVHAESSQSLEEQRKQAENVAQKMVGFYQNLPRTA